MVDNVASVFVDKFYEMDPEFETILFTGAELREGMIVLLEDSLMRADVGTSDRELNRYELDRAKEVNRWCEVVRVAHAPLRDTDCETGQTYTVGTLVEFLAKYPDGTMRKRRYNTSYAWIVKKETM